MKLSKFLEAAAFRICGGAEFFWDCYPNARYLDVSNTDGKEVSHCLFSSINQDVYEINVSIEEDDTVYRWINPSFEKAYKKEAKKFGVDSETAYDDVKYINIKNEDEILTVVEKAVHEIYVHSHTPKIVLPE